MNVDELLTSKKVGFFEKGKDLVVHCLSPDHDDSNPSMRIDKISGAFNCFSCEFKGNIFTYFGQKPNQLQLRKERVKNLIAQKLAESTGLVFPKNITKYDGCWRDIKPETYVKFEAFKHSNPEFISRINFPIRDGTGRIVAFNGRLETPGNPKYMISPPGAKLPLFPSVQPINSSVILVEGIFDMLNLHDKGLTNAICFFGTKQVNEEKLSILYARGVSHVDIFFDGDTAGQTAAENVRELCDNLGFSTGNISFKGKDPGDLTETEINKIYRDKYAKF